MEDAAAMAKGMLRAKTGWKQAHIGSTGCHVRQTYLIQVFHPYKSQFTGDATIDVFRWMKPANSKRRVSPVTNWAERMDKDGRLVKLSKLLLGDVPFRNSLSNARRGNTLFHKSHKSINEFQYHNFIINPYF